MRSQLEAGAVRIFNAEGLVVGTGFLVTEEIIFTCAHVVTAAITVQECSSDIPIEALSLDFPLVASGQPFTAHIIQWFPPQSPGEDIALLRLDERKPEDAQAIPLFVTDDHWGHDFRVFGFPANHDEGVWASGKLRAREATGWVQMEDIKETGHRIQPGFSGGAVWDEQLDGVVGMVVAADEPATRAAYMIPTKTLIARCPQLDQQAMPYCPYRGLFAFREQDAPFFFGRKTFTVQLIEAIQQRAIAVVLGPSGSGKSSVLQAGLLPRLRQEQPWLIATFRPGGRPFHELAAALIPLLEPTMSETDRLVEINKLAERFLHEDLTLRDVLKRIGQKHEVPLLLIADQFEELYTLSKETAIRQQFLDMLLDAFEMRQNGQSALVLALRADFLGQALGHREFADICQQAMLILPPMTHKQLREVIEQPAQEVGVTFAPGLVERILSDIEQEPGHLPLLEFALTLLWKRQEKRHLTHAEYDEIGGIKGALILYADQMYESLSDDEKERMRRVLVQMVRPGDGTADTRRIVTRAELGEEDWMVVRQLADKRLVVTNIASTGQQTAEIVHEALIQTWARLRTWMDEDRTFREWQERFRIAIKQWKEKNRDEGTLLHGALLTEVLRWMQLRRQEFSVIERTYICHSILYQGEKDLIEDWQLRYGTLKDTLAFLERYEDRLNETKLIAGIDALRKLSTNDPRHKLCRYLQQLLLKNVSWEISTHAAVGICERGHYTCLNELLASKRLNKWQRRNITGVLEIVRDLPGVGWSMNKALPSSEKNQISINALTELFSSHKMLFLIIMITTLLSGFMALMIVTNIWGIVAGNSVWLRNQVDISSLVTSLVIGIISATIALVCGTIRFLQKSVIDEIPLSMKCIRESLVIGSVLILPIPTVLMEAVITTNSQPSLTIGYCILVLCNLLGIIAGIAILVIAPWSFFQGRRGIWQVLWVAALYASIEMLLQVSIMPQITQFYLEIAQLPLVRIWNGLTSILLNHLYNPESVLFPVPSMLIFWLTNFFVMSCCLLGFRVSWFLAEWFERNKETVVLESSLLPTGTIELLYHSFLCPTLRSLKTTEVVVVGNAAGLRKVALRFTMLALLLCVGLVAFDRGIFWYAQQTYPQHPYTYRGHTGLVRDVAWSPDGTRIASAGDDGTVQVWNAVTGRILQVYKGHSGAVYAVAWSSDGTRIASGGNDKKVQVWDAATGTSLGIYDARYSSVDAIAWSPDGTYIASVTEDMNDGKTLQVWNIQTGKEQLSYPIEPIKHENGVEYAYILGALTWSPDSARIATAISTTADSGTKEFIFDVKSRKMLSSTNMAARVSVIAATWLSDSKRIIWGTATFAHGAIEIKMNVCNALTGKTLSSTLASAYSIPMLEISYFWSPDMKHFALMLNNIVDVWDIQLSDKPSINGPYVYTGSSKWVFTVAWSPDGKHIASVGDDKTVQVWDVV